MAMQFKNYTTTELQKLKEQFEYTAQMAALEGIKVDPDATLEYAALVDELARRENPDREGTWDAGL